MKNVEANAIKRCMHKRKLAIMASSSANFSQQADLAVALNRVGRYFKSTAWSLIHDSVSVSS